MNSIHPLRPCTPVEFDIAQGLLVGTGIITGAEYDDGWLYCIGDAQVARGDISPHLNQDDCQLRVWDFEVHPLGETPEGDEP